MHYHLVKFPVDIETWLKIAIVDAAFLIEHPINKFYFNIYKFVIVKPSKDKISDYCCNSFIRLKSEAFIDSVVDNLKTDTRSNPIGFVRNRMCYKIEANKGYINFNLRTDFLNKQLTAMNGA